MIYQLQNIRKTVGSFSLKIENCQIKKGKIYSVIGANGGGKSTLLNTLSLIEPPSKGKVIFSGQKINYANKNDLLNKKRKIGYLLQNPYLFNMSVYDNVSCGLKIRGFKPQETKAKVNRILKEFSLTDLASRKPSQLSGGEAQRVALARTLVLDSDVFLLDEPTANVDKKNIHNVEKIIFRLNQEKKSTVIITTHSQYQAFRMSRDIISIVNGQIKDIAYENVFSGTLKKETDKIKTLALSEGIALRLGSGDTGPVTIAVDPSDIILSKSELSSSALNSFSGTIVRLDQANGSLRVFVDIGVEFCALITHHSFYNMSLNIGKKVWLTFKANSIKVL
ncbi:MAG: ABC transporter ATP-binding protein [Candidatus Omnitrophica bacterium]|nr:ABC transporter ATP-binding protein [Candidatus Omnitrophota bacterium]